ncbi:MAG: triose-phosphate isomerase [Leptospiraceae bacterium]|nr:triose-phosphate isomerase [Leptospiraceae bacterium]MCB1199723.1 triose-phosphate isomerase [Leptospiraceae bacterium]
MNRIPVIAANWKMNLNRDDAKKLAASIAQIADSRVDREFIVFPGFLTISDVHEIITGTTISLGGQNLHYEESGAFTGEISALQLKDSGCSHVLVGHSERRHYFKENYETVNRKVHRALQDGLKVMLCVGESLEEREQTITEMVVVDQLESALARIALKNLKNMYIAYEPIWAIGTGKNATPEDANHVHQIIRKTISRLFNEKVADEMRILYGGSVKGENITELMQQEHIDGVLVGGASLKPESFASIMDYK